MNIRLESPVVFVTNDENAINYKWERGSSQLKKIQIVSIEDIISGDTNLPANIDIGTTLIQNPFCKKEYFNLRDNVEYRIIQAKKQALLEIVRYLGAKECIISAEYLGEEERIFNSDGNISYKAIQLDAKVRKERTENYRQKYHHKEIFNPLFNMNTYMEAKKLAKTYKLNNDQEIVHLFQQRSPNETALMTEQTIKIETSSELNSSLDIACRLNVMQGVFSLGVDFKQIVSKKMMIRLETYIKF